MNSYRVNFTAPNGARVGINVPFGIEPEAIVAEYEHMQRQVLFGRCREVVSVDGPPNGFRRRVLWLLRCAHIAIRRWARQIYTHTLGRRALERELKAWTEAFCQALSQEPNQHV